MSRNLSFCARILLIALSFKLSPLSAAPATATNATSVTNESSLIHPLQPGPEDGRIAFLTAKLLEQYHYSHHVFDDSISSQFLDRYLESLDPQHLHFLQSDLKQFERYRTNLDNLTLTQKGVGDTSPAFVIFTRFMERLKQRVDYADDLLKNENFEFNTNERIAIDRRDAPYPQDLNAAKVLWRQRLRFEYLQEKLGLDSKKTKPGSTNDSETAEPEKSVHEQIVDTLTHRYGRTFRMFTDWDNDDVLGIYLTALTHVYDPHSDYFNKEALDQFKISMNLQLFGIGAELRSEDGYCKIERLLAGGPAMKSNKIAAGNYIVAVAQSNQPPVDVVDMSITKIVQMIRGPKGTQVQLTLTPGAKSSKRSVITLVRDEIPLEDQAAKGKIIELPNAKGGTTRLGVINLPSFYAPMLDTPPAGSKKEILGKYTSVDVAKLLTKFKEENVSGVILDLRYNGGGSLEEAIKLTGLFIKDGPVVQVKDEEKTQVDRDTDPTITYDGPLIVLTSRFSASASEIVAGALQDYGRALIVGDSSTHGKGTVQTVQSLKPFLRPTAPDADEHAALKFTIKKFYRASGASTQLKGVLPDIVLPSRWNYSKDIGETSLENPLPWDTIPSAKYDKVNMVQPYLSELLKRSNERVATNQDFVYVRQDIEEFRKQQDDKSISLNEKLRLKEKDELEARQKARDKELLARKDPDEKVYELTLKQADLPGLPAPVQKTNSLAFKPNLNLTGTNATVAVKAPPTDVTESDEDLEMEGKPPAVDANLNETEQILLDYLQLASKQNPLVATQGGLKNN